jgi:hypothetical protein
LLKLPCFGPIARGKAGELVSPAQKSSQRQIGAIYSPASSVIHGGGRNCRLFAKGGEIFGAAWQLLAYKYVNQWKTIASGGDKTLAPALLKDRPHTWATTIKSKKQSSRRKSG